MTAAAQSPTREIRYQQQAWLMYQLQFRLTNRWGGILETHYRRSGHFIDHPGTQLNRIGLSFFPSQTVRMSANYAYLTLRNAFNTGPARPEHRTWAEVGLSLPVSRLAFNQRIRVEQRFVRRSDGQQLLEGYRFNHRLRYQLGLVWPLRRPAPDRFSPNLVINNEVLFNAGRAIQGSHFDQNQFFAGIACPLGHGLVVQTGYMNLFQQLSGGNRFVNSHILRLTLFQSINFQP